MTWGCARSPGACHGQRRNPGGVGHRPVRQPCRFPLLGIGVRAPKERQEDNVFKLACATAELCGIAGAVRRDEVIANSDYVGAGYGFSTPGGIEAIRMLASLEGILLDPVYTAKGMAGLIDLIRKGRFTRGQNVVFVHTGGSVGLFGYVDDFGPRPSQAPSAHRSASSAAWDRRPRSI